MTGTLLLKGFEVELFTGKPDGTVVGCSAEAAAALEGFVTEPDCRNLEYTTPPDASYPAQLELLLEPRRRLRPWLAQRGLTLLPGSTLSTGDSTRFERSNPDNPYHAYIEASYGTRVVTASVHINLGLTDMDAITLSTSRLVSTGHLETATAWRMILISGLSNIAFKMGLAALLGARSFVKPVLAGLGIALLGGVGILVLWP